MLWICLLVAGLSSDRKRRSEQAEHELVARCKRGERDALNELFESHYADVRRIVARLLGPSPDLEDVVQQAMLEIYKSLKSFKGQARLSSWIFKVAMNVANQHLRRHLRHPQPLDLDERLADGGQSPLAQTLAREDVQRVWDIVRALPENGREVFVLADVEGVEPAEIAKTLGLTPSAVYTRLHHARREFWQRLERQGHFHFPSDDDE